MMECGAANNSCRFERAGKGFSLLLSSFKFCVQVKENMFLTRSCANVYLRDCKTANSIEFCYCTQDLCNFLGPFGDNEEGDSPGEGKIVLLSKEIILAIVFLEGFEGSGLETTTVGKPTSLNPNRNVTYVTTIELPKSLCSICQFSDLLLTLSTLLLMYLFIP